MVNPGGSSIAESKILLWCADGTDSTLVTGTTQGTFFLQDGNNVSTLKGSASNLFTLNSSWSPNQLYAFETTIWASASTSGASLYDFTSNTRIVATQVTTTSATAQVLRSPQFTLVPGHIYGVTIWNNSSTVYITDASLIVFG